MKDEHKNYDDNGIFKAGSVGYKAMPDMGSSVFGPMARDLRVVFNCIEDLGFRQPPLSFYKPDSRGPEYGHYEVLVRDSDCIDVINWIPGESFVDGNYKASYEMRFSSIENFCNWVKSGSATV